ncbi:MAG: hypothetical protein DRH34_05295 [Deltaproteobacteria bacterium]|nr:MAG: hypothetical protein DRH34_05295 [Deltaproteobacteria bacterium]RLC21311.1 MAG: hypothetical protein DRH93_12010 [Deltaproteobacteria bacterium]
MFKRSVSEDYKQTRVKNRRVHMANERTFLSWIRTSIGIMAFGFVIEKFSLPLDHAKIAVGDGSLIGHQSLTFLGVFLVAMGAFAGLLATYRFQKTERQIMEDTYQPSIVSDILIAILLAAIGILLSVYLIHIVSAF